MKRFLLVNPWIHDLAAFDFWLKPLGLLRVAGALRDAGAEAHLLDLLDRNHPWLPQGTSTDAWGRGKFFAEEITKPPVFEKVSRKFKRYGLPRKTLEERLAELPEVDAVLVTSGMSYWYTGVKETIEVLRQRYPDKPMVLGGLYPSLLPDHARAHSGADVVLPGSFESRRTEAESSLGIRLPDTPCHPAWELYPKFDYAVMTISKGCPFRCTYCASSLLEPRFVSRDVEDVLSELRDIHSLGVTRIAFYDDALLYHPRFDEILQGIVKLDADFEFHTPNGLHVTEITRGRAGLMSQAGFRSLYLSLETIDERILEATGAKLTPDAFSKAARVLKNAGFKKDELHAYILFGLPAQSEESVRRTIDLAISEDVTPHLAEFSPVPGTPEYGKAGLNEDTDPLLTNNTFWCARPGIGDSLERLKEYLRRAG